MKMLPIMKDFILGMIPIMAVLYGISLIPMNSILRFIFVFVLIIGYNIFMARKIFFPMTAAEKGKWLLSSIISRLIIIIIITWIMSFDLDFVMKFVMMFLFLIFFIGYRSWKQMYPNGIRRMTPEEIKQRKEGLK